MKALIYVNKEKDASNTWCNQLKKSLTDYNIDYSLLSDEDLKKNISADVIFVLGGDGTILYLSEFANANGIPIIGINAGKIGFLTEFEKDETELAVKTLKENLLIAEKRIALISEINGEKFVALNDCVIQRIYDEKNVGIIASIKITIDNVDIADINGDGIIISTPTGSTAYSLSAGGAILAPGINALSLTPISAHTLSQRPIIYSADSKLVAKINTGSVAGLYIDGKFIQKLYENNEVIVSKSKTPIVFLRRKTTNFYKKVVKKLASTEKD